MVYEGSWLKDQYNGKGSLFLISIPKITNHNFTDGHKEIGKMENFKVKGQ